MQSILMAFDVLSQLDILGVLHRTRGNMPLNTVCMPVPVPRNMSMAKLGLTSPVLKAQLERRLHGVIGHGHRSLNVDFWKGALMVPL